MWNNKNVIRESFYTDNTASPYPYVSKLGSYENADNWEELEREEQKNDDWESMKTPKYSAEKFSPILAKDYNHNVKHGREGAEVYVGGYLDESKVYNIIRRMVNEAIRG